MGAHHRWGAPRKWYGKKNRIPGIKPQNNIGNQAFFAEIIGETPAPKHQFPGAGAAIGPKLSTGLAIDSGGGSWGEDGVFFFANGFLQTGKTVGEMKS